MPATEISPTRSGPPHGSPASSSPNSEYLPLLIEELQDRVARSRMREAFWMSVVGHLLVVIAIVGLPKYMATRRVVPVNTAEDLMRQKELTYLELPPDAQKLTRRPDTNIISDKDRTAQSRIPSPDRKTLQELRDARRPGPPQLPGPPAAPVSPAAPQMAQVAPSQQSIAPPAAKAGAPQPPPPPQQPPQTAQLQQPAFPKVPFGGGALSPGSAIEQAARATANARAAGVGQGGEGGAWGMGLGSGGQAYGNMDVLSDTMGVDFGPYLARVLHDVRYNWYNLIPEVARAPLMKKGKVSIEFAIMKDGRVAGMRLTAPSGDISLDRAAWGGITASDPFPPLPGEFKGSYLALRFHFFYNPDKNDLQ